MIRPQRFFIMPRSTARLSRKTAVRFTLITCAHSSSDIRMNRLSRVTPALFTRMSSPPIASVAAFGSASTEAASERSQGVTCTREPSSPASASSGPVRVPDSATVAPCRVQRPGDRPADAARSRRSPAPSCRSDRTFPFLPSRRQRLGERLDVGRRVDCPRRELARLIRRARPVSTLPAPISTSSVTPCPAIHSTHSRQRTDARDLLDQQVRGSRRDRSPPRRAHWRPAAPAAP